MSETDATLDIRLFGEFELLHNGQPVGSFPSRKADALLIYLASHERPFSRDILADFFWDDRDQQQAFANLRSILSSLRKAVGDYLSISRKAIAFEHGESVWLDTAVFAQTIEPLLHQLAQDEPLTDAVAAELETAVALYRGDLLEGFHIRDSLGFEEWLTQSREQFRQQVSTAYRHLLQHALQNGRYQQGIQHAQRLLTLDPLDESTQRNLMLLLARSGQRSAALAQYESCRRLLDEELGVPPMPETTALYTRIHAANADARLNLPPQPTPFVGREAELGDLRRQLANADTRLLTILGPGGMGKTRLALQTARLVAEQQAGMFLNGIRFVPLAPLNDARFLINAIADAVGLTLSGQSEPQQQLLTHLADKELLLILDNVEHLLETPRAVSGLLQTILDRAPDVTLLLTSRVRLNLHEEWVFDIAGLQVPDAANNTSLDAFSATTLFVQNARRVNRHFAPTPADTAAIVHICRLLNGMPLGIEMSAAWVRHLSCADIVRGIEEDLDFLSHAQGSVPDRHSSLRAVFVYSWRLLGAREQAALRQLSVFRGGFSREAATSVANAALTVLISLADRSWVRRVATAEQTAVRYEMLEVLRQYAAEQLTHDPAEQQTAVRQRHLAFYARFLQERQLTLQGGNQKQALAEIEVEIENIRAAWRWAVSQADLTALNNALEGLFRYYDTGSWFQEGAQTFGEANEQLAHLPDSREKRIVVAKLTARQAWFLFHLGRYETSEQLMQQSLQTLRAAHVQPEIVFCLNYLGAMARHRADYAQANAFLNEALTISQEMKDSYGVSIALNILGQVASLQGDYATARDYCQRSLAIKRQIKDRWGMTYSLTYLGRVAEAQGELDEAAHLFQESLAISETLGDQRGVAFAWQNLGDVALEQRDFLAAQDAYQRALSIFADIGNHLGQAFILQKLGETSHALTQYDTAARYFADGLHEALSIRSEPAMIQGLLRSAVFLHATKHPNQAAQQLTFLQQSDAIPAAEQSEAARLLDQLTLAPQAPRINSLEGLVATLLSDSRLPFATL